jgi:hypothetical protein
VLGKCFPLKVTIGGKGKPVLSDELFSLFRSSWPLQSNFLFFECTSDLPGGRSLRALRLGEHGEWGADAFPSTCRFENSAEAFLVRLPEVLWEPWDAWRRPEERMAREPAHRTVGTSVCAATAFSMMQL